MASIFTTREYMVSTFTYCYVLTVYPFGFSATIVEKVNTEKRTVHVHTATGWNVDVEMNVDKGSRRTWGGHLYGVKHQRRWIWKKGLGMIGLRESPVRRIYLTRAELTKGGKWSVKGAARGKGAKYPTKNMATESATESRRHSWKIEQVFARTV